MLRHFPHGRTARARIVVVTALSASLLAAAFTVPAPSVASGNDESALTHRKSQLDHAITGSHADVDEISRELQSAQARLDTAAADLAAARAKLDALHVQVQQATIRDQRMQRALDEALQRLADARLDFTRGRATVGRQRSDLAGYAVSSSAAQLGQLSTLNLIVSADSPQAAISQVQGANSALDKQLTDLQRLQANQVLLRFTEQRIKAAAAQVATDRRQAAANLVAQQELEDQAAAAETTVEQQVAGIRERRSSLSAAKTNEIARISTMEKERAHLEERLRRIAAARAAAAARRAAAAARRAAEQRAAEQRAAQQRAAEQRAAQQRAAQQRAAQQRAAQQQAAQQQAASSAGSSTSSSTTAGGFLSWPVTNTYITSPYGMRMHPILHIWELHDGTDFHAVCGTPVYAAADGRVLSEYYNTGYGNRVVIDHGYVRGVSLATSYNHLTSFVAHTGQQVSRGQLIAYAGTTGYSTGCHLHFMVYVNGATVDPMTWLGSS